MNQHIFSACCVCEKYRPSQKSDPTKDSLHGACLTLQTNGHNCIVQKILLGEIAAYKSQTPLPADVEQLRPLTARIVRTMYCGTILYKAIDPDRFLVAEDFSLPVLKDKCVRRTVPHTLAFTPADEELVCPVDYIFK